MALWAELAVYIVWEGVCLCQCVPTLCHVVCLHSFHCELDSANV